jgi:hypothetical protein
MMNDSIQAQRHHPQKGWAHVWRAWFVVAKSIIEANAGSTSYSNG